MTLTPDWQPVASAEVEFAGSRAFSKVMLPKFIVDADPSSLRHAFPATGICGVAAREAKDRGPGRPWAGGIRTASGAVASTVYAPIAFRRRVSSAPFRSSRFRSLSRYSSTPGAA